VKSNGTPLKNAADVVKFHQENMNKPHAAYVKSKLLVMRYLHLVKVGDVDHKRSYDCITIERSRKRHSI
jgi:hypothetical protein